MSGRVLIAAALALGACQLDDPVEPIPPSTAAAPERVASESCSAYAARELSVPAVSGDHDVAGHRISIDVDGSRFSWRSTLGIDAVIAAGPAGANAYVYRGEAAFDRGLVAPRQNGVSAIERIRFCYDWELDVSVTAASSLSNVTRWSIERSAERERVVLAPEQSIDVPYSVVARAVSTGDGPMTVAGAIEIANRSPLAAQVTGIEADALGVEASLDCGRVLPFEIAAGLTVSCNYSATLASPRDGAVRVNVLSAGGVESASASAAVDRDSARIDRRDDCIDVRGHRGQRLGRACAADSPARFSYSVPVGPKPCGTSRDDSLELDIVVACDAGCTRSAAEWQLRSARPGDVRAALQTQLRAVDRNIEAGASATEIRAARDAAVTMLATYDTADDPIVRDQLTGLTRDLRDYNTGDLGPSACSK